MFDVLIIGSGPAGVSCALYAVRAGLDACIVSKGMGALENAENIENYYGFAEPVSAKRLYDDSVANAKRLGACLITDEIMAVEYDGGFNAVGKHGRYSAKALLIATGSSRKAPPVKGIADFTGRGVSYCATCDAFFFRGKKVGVLGGGDFALHEAEYLAGICGSVTVLTNGRDAPDTDIRCDTRVLAQLYGEARLGGVTFDDGESEQYDGIFVAEGVAGASALALKLGAIVENGDISVDRNMHTSIPGLFAAGDCTGGLRQICKAVSDGAIAATEIIKFIKRKK